MDQNHRDEEDDAVAFQRLLDDNIESIRFPLMTPMEVQQFQNTNNTNINLNDILRNGTFQIDIESLVTSQTIQFLINFVRQYFTRYIIGHNYDNFMRFYRDELISVFNQSSTGIPPIVSTKLFLTKIRERKSLLYFQGQYQNFANFTDTLNEVRNSVDALRNGINDLTNRMTAIENAVQNLNNRFTNEVLIRRVDKIRAENLLAKRSAKPNAVQFFPDFSSLEYTTVNRVFQDENAWKSEADIRRLTRANLDLIMEAYKTKNLARQYYSDRPSYASIPKDDIAEFLIFQVLLYDLDNSRYSSETLIQNYFDQL